ncbi:hypothetical protein NITHO_2880003 [Nitrolancea hollandica Lb]|uniref:Uncharacterized protein n=1 Tax=Nitrolancea hollandica Lb TaxID=1129897 RepID=I4EGX4_9BACT|nr:hypothetical protein NITHO_2880003 [Nitrolancea hollandica Lb]
MAVPGLSCCASGCCVRHSKPRTSAIVGWRVVRKTAGTAEDEVCEREVIAHMIASPAFTNSADEPYKWTRFRNKNGHSAARLRVSNRPAFRAILGSPRWSLQVEE